MTTPTQPISDEELALFDNGTYTVWERADALALRERLRLAEAVCESASILATEVLADYSAYGEAVDVNHLLIKWRAARGGK